MKMIKRNNFRHARGQVAPLAILLIFISSYLLLSIAYNVMKFHWSMNERRETYLCAYQIQQLYTELIKKVGTGNKILAGLNLGYVIPGLALESYEAKKLVIKFQDLSFIQFNIERISLMKCLNRNNPSLTSPYQHNQNQLLRDPFSLAIPINEIPNIELLSNKRRITKELSFLLILNFSKINKLTNSLDFRVTEKKGEIWN